MRVLVTGAHGFVGKHICQALAERGHEVAPTARRARSGGEYTLELPDEAGTAHLLDEVEPDALIHLAALSEVPRCEDDPELAHTVNVLGTRSIVRALAASGTPCRLLHVSSAVVYGCPPPADQPVTEETLPRPVNVYGRTKLAAEEEVLEAEDRLSCPPIIVRPFNHFGPGQLSCYALAGFARQLALMEEGASARILRTGDLSVRRDFLDVRDVVSAYIALLETEGVSGRFVVASGQAPSLRELVETLAGYCRVPFEIVTDERLCRANDLPVLLGDATALTAKTGWRPRVQITQGLLDLLDHWRRTQSLA